MNVARAGTALLQAVALLVALCNPSPFASDTSGGGPGVKSHRNPLGPQGSQRKGRWKVQGVSQGSFVRAATLPAIVDLALPEPACAPGLARPGLCAEITKPDSLRIFLSATPHNHRAPPA